MTIGPPIPEIQFDLENSRSKVKVKGTPLSAASSWLNSLVFHIMASYRLPSLSFHDNQASPFPRYNLTLKIQGQRYPSQRSIQFTHFCSVSHQASYRLLSLSFHDNRASHSIDIIFKVKCQGTLVSEASNWLISFYFTSIGPTIPKIWQIECSTRENGFKILRKKNR